MVAPLIAPAVWALVAGTAAETSYAWYDPDLFTKGIWSNYELEQRVETLNNYWQNLWRAGGKNLAPSSDASKKLSQYMDGWWDFKQRFDDAIFRRAADPFGIWGAKADYENELNDVWVPRFRDTAAAVISADPLVKHGLESRGVDMDTYLARSGLNPDGTSKSSNAGLYLGVFLTVSLLGIGAFLAAKHS